MNPIIIPIHSFVDVITNSSSEIYVSSTQKTVDAIKNAVSLLLKISGSPLEFSDLFEKIELVYEIEYFDTKKDKWITKFLTSDEINAVRERLSEMDYDATDEKTGIARSDVFKGECDEYPECVVRMTPKTELQHDETIKKLADALISIPSSVECESVYNG